MVCAVLLELGDPEANAMLSHLLQHFPGEAEGWSEIGRALRSSGKFEAALLAFTRASNSAPEPRYELERASVLLASGRITGALASLRKARVLFPEVRRNLASTRAVSA